MGVVLNSTIDYAIIAHIHKSQFVSISLLSKVRLPLPLTVNKSEDILTKKIILAR